MAGLSTLALLSLTAASTASQFATQRQQANALERQGEYERELYARNAALAEAQAQDAIARGHEAELRLRRRVRQMIGSQRAALAAQGVEVNADTAADIQRETGFLGELDALTIRNNARREAFGFRVQAADLAARGELAQFAAANQAAALRTESLGTLLTGTAQTYGILRQYGGSGPKKKPALPSGTMAPMTPGLARG